MRLGEQSYQKKVGEWEEGRSLLYQALEHSYSLYKNPPCVKGVTQTSEMAHNHLGFPVQSDYVSRPQKCPLSAIA